jgi:quercetin dioxygenase-like cupin family protein
MSLYSWNKIPKEKLQEDISRKVISGEKVMAAHVFLRKGAVVPAHSHESEQLTYILKGLLELTLPSGVFRVGEGEVLVIPSNIEHSAVALEDTLDMDVFSPIREDWLLGEDHYLRGEKQE